MRIAYLIPLREADCERLIAYDRDNTPITSVNSFLMWMILEYVKRGNQVVVFAITGGPQVDYVGKNIEVHNMHIFNHGNVRGLQKFVPDLRRMAQTLKEAKCEIFHAQWCYEFAAAALLVDPKKTLITMHDYPDAIAPYLGNFYWRRRLELGRKNVTAASYFTAVSPYMQALVQEGKEGPYRTKDVNYGYGLKLETTYQNIENNLGFVQVVPNFLIPSQLASMEFVENRKYNLKEPTIITLNDGFSDRKNCQKGMQAFALLKKKLPGARLLMLGGDFQKGGVAESYAKEQGIEDGIEFLGFVPSSEVRSLMEKADLCLSTSREESFGMTFIEAMGVGTLSTGGINSGAVPWVLDDGKAGLLQEVENPEAMAEKMYNAFLDEASYRQQVMYARQYVEEHFMLNVVADKYLEIYEEMQAL